jgi:L-asparagine oxygenase
MYINLTKKELEQLKVLSLQLTIDPFKHPDLYCNKSKELSQMVPKRISNLLTSFVENGSTDGYILFRNLLFDDILPDTPLDNTQNIGCNTLLSRVQSILLSVMSELISYESECNGFLFQDIVPIKDTERIQTSTSSKTELEIHTEQAFSPLKPDILSLACIRGDLNALTYILTVNTIFENISLDDLEQLFRPLWLIGVDYSFKIKEEKFLAGDIRGPISILNGSIIDPKLVFDQDLMTGLTDTAKDLIIKLVKIYYDKRSCYNLQAGEILFIDNNRAVHGRSSFSPKYDGNDRFLIRTFGVFDIKKSEYARTDSDNYRKVLSIYS